MMDVTVQAVLRLWEQDSSQREIAKRVGISEPKVRRILITAGYISTDEAAMYQDGKTIDEIATLTGKTRNAVLGRLPYDKGMYGAEYPTVNALRIRKSRERRQNDKG